jgi:hypothetical protein
MIVNEPFPLPITPDLWWPKVPPLGLLELDFQYDATLDVTVNGIVDPITSVSFATMPAGELLPNSGSATTTLVNVWLTGGVSGRVYTHQLIIGTAGGRSITKYIGQVCDPVLAPPVLPLPTTPGFSSPLTWS